MKEFVMEGDSRTRLMMLTVPRIAYGVDLSGLAWSVAVRNARGETDVQLPEGTPQITDKGIMVPWLIRGVASSCPGETLYSLIGVGEDECGRALKWQSEPCSLMVAPAIRAEKQADESGLTALDTLIRFVEGKLSGAEELFGCAEGIIAEAQTAVDRAEALERRALEELEKAAALTVRQEETESRLEASADKSEALLAQCGEMLNGEWAPAITAYAEGTVLEPADIAPRALKTLMLYGRSEAPDPPEETVTFVSEPVNGEGEVLTEILPFGLRGIPVPWSGNHVDASGQEWICDTLEAVSGMRTRRVQPYCVDGSQRIDLYRLSAGNLFRVRLENVPANLRRECSALCGEYEVVTVNERREGTLSNLTNGTLDFIDSRFDSVDAFREYLREHPIRLFYALAEPVEERTEGKLLPAGRRMSVSGNCEMRAEYIADTEKWILKKLEERYE